MSKLFQILGFLVLFSTSALTQEKYFHDLRGIEDSTGTTHLFYRVFEQKTVNCSYYDYESDSYIPSTTTITDNNVYHFNLSTETDTLKFTDTTNLYSECYTSRGGTYKFTFFDNHPDSTFEVMYFYGGLSGGYFIENKRESFDLGFGNPLGVSFDSVSRSFIVTGKTTEIVIKAANDDYTKGFGTSFRYTKGDSLWSNANHFGDVPDSLFIDFLVMGVNPFKKGQYVGFKDSSIVISEDYGQTFQRISSHNWELYDFYLVDDLLPQIPIFDETIFDADSGSFYLKFYARPSSRSLPSSTSYVVKKVGDSWEYINISEDRDNFSFSIENNRSGSLYFANSNEIFYSTDYGENSTKISSLAVPITGIYKKPNSDILYISTTEELIEFKVSTNEQTILKVLPVSAEVEPEQPKTITLHQNYPNPFNPSTVISYHLTGNSMVRLRVFDALGREVAVLVDELQSAGRHQITFDAAGLASGVYYYVLNADEQILTKKLTLIK